MYTRKYKIEDYYSSVAQVKAQAQSVSVADVLGGLFTLALGAGLVGFAAYVLSTVL